MVMDSTKLFADKKYLLFDFDGTIVDSSQGIFAAIQYALKQLNLPAVDQKILNTFIGPPLLDSFIQLGLSADLAKQAVSCYRSFYEKEAMYQLQMYPKIKESLQILSQSYPLYIASSKPEVFVKQLAEHLAIAQYFTGIYGADLSGERSKKADVISYALASANLKANEGVMIGDRSHDCSGAKINQLSAIGVLYGFGSQKELLSAGADYLCASPEELVLLFKKEALIDKAKNADDI